MYFVYILFFNVTKNLVKRRTIPAIFKQQLKVFPASTGKSTKGGIHKFVLYFKVIVYTTVY